MLQLGPEHWPPPASKTLRQPTETLPPLLLTLTVAQPPISFLVHEYPIFVPGDVHGKASQFGRYPELLF